MRASLTRTRRRDPALRASDIGFRPVASVVLGD